MRGAATTAMRDISEERQRSRRPRAAANPEGAWGLRPHASLLVVIDATTSIPPRASPGTRKPHARGPCQYSDTLLARPPLPGAFHRLEQLIPRDRRGPQLADDHP